MVSRRQFLAGSAAVAAAGLGVKTPKEDREEAYEAGKEAHTCANVLLSGSQDRDGYTMPPTELKYKSEGKEEVDEIAAKYAEAESYDLSGLGEQILENEAAEDVSMTLENTCRTDPAGVIMYKEKDRSEPLLLDRDSYREALEIVEEL